MGSKILVADDSITIQKVIGLTFANEDFDLEEHQPKNCILTGAPIEDFYYEELDDD